MRWDVNNLEPIHRKMSRVEICGNNAFFSPQFNDVTQKCVLFTFFSPLFRRPPSIDVTLFSFQLQFHVFFCRWFTPSSFVAELIFSLLLQPFCKWHIFSWIINRRVLFITFSFFFIVSAHVFSILSKCNRQKGNQSIAFHRRACVSLLIFMLWINFQIR